MSTEFAERVSIGRYPMLALGLVVVAGSTGAIFVRWTNAASIVDAFYRLLFTTLLLLPVTVARYRDDFQTVSLRDLDVAITASVLLAVHFARGWRAFNGHPSLPRRFWSRRKSCSSP